MRRIPAGTTPGLGEAVRAQDPLGFTVELVHEMAKVDRLIQRHDLRRGASISRIDHVNLAVPDATRPGNRAIPLLAALAGGGVRPRTHRLQPGSPAIDAVPASDAGCAPTDQRGIIRPPTPMMMEMRSAEAVQAKTAIVAGEIEVRATVTLTAALRN